LSLSHTHIYIYMPISSFLSFHLAENISFLYYSSSSPKSPSFLLNLGTSSFRKSKCVHIWFWCWLNLIGLLGVCIELEDWGRLRIGGILVSKLKLGCLSLNWKLWKYPEFNRWVHIVRTHHWGCMWCEITIDWD